MKFESEERLFELFRNAQGLEESSRRRLGYLIAQQLGGQELDPNDVVRQVSGALQHYLNEVDPTTEMAISKREMALQCLGVIVPDEAEMNQLRVEADIFFDD